MANNNKNMNELVADDDDPTSELEVLNLQSSEVIDELEADASTAGLNSVQSTRIDDEFISDLKSDLQTRSETINRLQFDMTQLRAKWLGLETEIQEREKITRQLNVELAESGLKLKRNKELLKKRDKKNKALKLEIRERDDAYRTLQENIETIEKHIAASSGDDTQPNEQILAMQAGQLASRDIALRELNEKNERLESYADQLRQQIQDSESDTEADDNTRELHEERLQEVIDQIQASEDQLATAKSSNDKLSQELADLGSAHAEEIRMIRFELGEAQETVTQHELITEQLASDLVENRSYRVELESMLSDTEESSKSIIEKLERQNRDLRRENEDQQQKLDTKAEAINCLLSELAKKAQQIESISEIENVMHEVDDRLAEESDDNSSADKERVTRVLVGSIDDQELRFPLFKDRLTIGRTKQNDIQIKASFISRRHAVIVTEGRATRVIDWGSKNGVFVNSKRVTEYFLKNGDIVTVGTAEFRYEERPKRDA